VLTALIHVEDWLQAPIDPELPLLAQEALAVAQQVRAQDVVSDEAGHPTLRDGVAKDRRISVEDGQMRHGRKSKNHLINGYKRHVLTDLDTGLIPAVGLTPANIPESEVTPALQEDLAYQSLHVTELAIDRAYLSSEWVRHRPADLQIVCKAWPIRNGTRFTKSSFTLDWEREQVICPHAITVPLRIGSVIHFSAEQCAACPVRDQCTTSSHGRCLSIHPDERFLEELRCRQQTPLGRAKLRERVAVEHTLAHVGAWQRSRARYVGIRKNLFDLRRCAIIQNLHIHFHSFAAA
jgi:Transposase DDE domain